MKLSEIVRGCIAFAERLELLTDEEEERKIIDGLVGGQAHDWQDVADVLLGVEDSVSIDVQRKIKSLFMDLKPPDLSPAERLSVKMRFENAIRTMQILEASCEIEASFLVLEEAVVWATTTLWSLTSYGQIFRTARRHLGLPW